jgi:hypothetical protein
VAKVRSASRRVSWPCASTRPSQRPSCVKRVVSMTMRRSRTMGVRGSWTQAVRARKRRSHSMPVALGSIATRTTRMGSSTSRRSGPTRVWDGSSGASREACSECCTPSFTMVNDASITRRLGYRPSATPK